MAERVILECNVPKCPTPEDDVKRCRSTIDKITVEIDLCAFHREPIMELRKYANRRRGRGRGRQIDIKVKNPEDIQRRAPRRT